ncbi:MAG: HD domain-containing protein [Gallionella sp.]|nr:HD domain-containing protein [Gallionella sp.]
MTYSEDKLSYLNLNISMRDKLTNTHRVLQMHLPFVERIAVTIYDPKTALLKSYVHSGGTIDPYAPHQQEMSETPSLEAIMKQGNPRIIADTLTFDDGKSKYNRLGRSGYAASYTMPMFHNGAFFGFIFFNSNNKDVFTQAVLDELDVFGHLISLLIISELSSIHTLIAAVDTAKRFTHQRDPETGSHLDRMSRYAWMIAKWLAQQRHLSNEYVEHVFMFAPLHDIGKISIPDYILFKPGKLTPKESEIMRAHARMGREIIDDMLNNFGLESIEQGSILRNIAEYHHEHVDGSGYPMGLKGEAIPLEARIVAVADTFDALTSRRSYKNAWSNDDAFDMLRQLSGAKLDVECVNIMIANRAEVEHIQSQFAENELG